MDTSDIAQGFFDDCDEDEMIEADSVYTAPSSGKKRGNGSSVSDDEDDDADDDDEDDEDF